MVMVATIAGSAQYQQSNTATANDGMTMQFVKTGLYMFSAKAGNSVLRLSGNGLIMVDGQLPGNYDALRARVKRISNQPIRVLILTDCDPSRTASNARFLEDGTPIVVQENAKPSVAGCNFPDGKASPIVTYASEYRIHLGGVDAQLMHFGNARTNSDTVVYFPNLKVVAVGGLFASIPNPDFSAGGSLATSRCKSNHY
jgi:glyoxylase-like metal-dependent hydrolase (beta-lactamase superfamily II)